MTALKNNNIFSKFVTDYLRLNVQTVVTKGF